MPPKVKLTKAERKLARKARALEKKRIRLLDYIKREINYGNITLRRHEKNWKEILTEITLKIMKDDMEFCWQSFEWAVDAKDCIISNLMDELEEANNQYAFNLKSHNKRIRSILNQFKEYLDSMEKYCTDQVEEMKARTKQQYDRCESRFLEQQEALNLFIYIMNKMDEIGTRDRMTSYFCLAESLTEEANEKNNFDNIYGTKMKKIMKDMGDIIKAYNDRYEKSLQITKRERASNDTSSGDMKKNLAKIVYLLALVKKLQAKLNILDNTDGVKLEQLNDTATEFSRILFILKNKLFKDTQVDEGQLRLLVASSQNTLHFFKEMNRKGELMVKLFNVSKKFETKIEKVLSYPVDKLILKLAHFSAKDLLNRQNLDMETKFLLFFQRIAAVEASRIALAEEKKALQLEQINMKRNLQKFCGCFVCPSLYMKDVERNKKKYGCLGMTVRIKRCQKNVFIENELPLIHLNTVNENE